MPQHHHHPYRGDIIEQQPLWDQLALILNDITIVLSNQERLLQMADAQTQALADLSTAITNLGTAIAAEITALQAALAANGTIQPNDSAAIEAAATSINTLTANLAASLPKPAPAPAP